MQILRYIAILGLMASEAQAEVTFDKDVLPIFETNCTGCHGETNPQANLNLLSLESVLSGSKHGDVIAVDQPGQSKLLQVVTGEATPQMPPQPLLPLTENEIDVLRQWLQSSPEVRGEAVGESFVIAEESNASDQPTGEAQHVEGLAGHEESLGDDQMDHRDDAIHAGIDFEKDVQPILNNNCVGCHGATNPAAGLSLFNFETLMDGARSGLVVNVNDPDKSKLFHVISGGEPQMPPKPLPPLTDDAIETLRLWIAAGAQGPQVEATDVKTPTEMVVQIDLDIDIEPSGPVGSIAFHPQERLLAVGRLHTVELFAIDDDNQEFTNIAVLPGHSQVVRGLAFSPDGTTLVAAGGQPAVGGEIIVWDVASHQPKLKITGHTDSIYSVVFSPDGSQIATCSYDRLIKLWDIESGEETQTLKDHIDAIYDLAFSPDGSRLASVAADRTLKLWNTENGKRLLTLSDALDALHTVTYHPDGTHIAAAGADNMIRVWQLGETSGKLLQSKFAHQGGVLQLQYSPDGQSLISSAEDQLVKIWDTDTYLETTVLPKQADWVNALSIDPSGNYLAVGRYDGVTSLYAINGELIASTGEESVEPLPEEIESESDGRPSDLAQADESETTEDGVIIVNDNAGLVDVVKGNGTYLSALQWLEPKALTKGKTTTLKIRGKNIDDAELIWDHDGIQGKLVGRELHPFDQLVRVEQNTAAEIVDTGRPQTLTVELTIDETVSPGIHSVKVKTPLAISNSLNFTVEDQEPVMEVESNDAFEDAPVVTFPNLLAGGINQFGDQDYFRFQAKAGQEWVFETVASAIGTGFAAILQIVDEQGTILADSREFGNRNDAQLGCRFAQDGEYALVVSDENLRSGGQYRIHVTTRPFITNVFPLGAQRGVETVFEVQGFNLKGTNTLRATIPEGHEGRDYTIHYENEMGRAINAIKIAAGDYPETREQEGNNGLDQAMPLQVPTTVNATLKRDDDMVDVDYYKFSAKKGQPVIVEVLAQQYGSPVDSYIEILTEQGEPIEIATVRCESETYVTLSDRDARSRGIRLDAWNDLKINDYMMIGSEILLVDKLPDYPDEDVIFRGSSVNGWRYGYFGTTPGHHAVLDPAYKVSIHPPKATFPPNGMPVFRLYAQNDDGGAPFHDKDSYFRFDPPEDGEYVVKVTDSFNQNGDNHTYRLSVHPPQPNYFLYSNTGQLNIPEGGSSPVFVTVARVDGFAGPVDIEIQGLPEGFTGSTGRIIEGEENTALTIHAEQGARSTSSDARFKVVARAKIGDEWVERENTHGMITVIKNPDVVISQEPEEIHLTAGETVQVKLTVERYNGFDGRVPIDVRNLPLGVYVMDTGLNGILIKEGENERTMTIYAEPWIQDVTIPIFSIANVETRSPIPNRNVSGISTLKITQPVMVSQN